MTAHAPQVTTRSATLTCPDCSRPWPCDGWRGRRNAQHRADLVLELVGKPPNYGWFCLVCSQPWPCKDAPKGSE